MDYDLFKKQYEIIPVEVKSNSFNECYTIYFELKDKAKKISKRVFSSNVYYKDITNETKQEIILLAFNKIKNDILEWANSLNFEEVLNIALEL